MGRATTTTRPNPLFQGQVTVNHATRTEPGTWLKASDFNKVLSLPVAFVFQHGNEVTPTHIGYRTGKFVVLHQAGNVELFYTDRLAFTDYSGRNPVEKVVPLVGYFFMLPS
ncbi:hypothetical protein GCM10027190_54330 [Spirosoma areae]